MPGTQDPYYDYTKIEQLREKYMKIDFFLRQAASVEELRKKQVLDTVKLLLFSEDKIKRVEEALAKFKTVDDAMEEIRKLSLEGHKLKENPNNDPKKIVDEDVFHWFVSEVGAEYEISVFNYYSGRNRGGYLSQVFRALQAV